MILLAVGVDLGVMFSRRHYVLSAQAGKAEDRVLAATHNRRGGGGTCQSVSQSVITYIPEERRQSTSIDTKTASTSFLVARCGEHGPLLFLNGIRTTVSARLPRAAEM